MPFNPNQSIQATMMNPNMMEYAAVRDNGAQGQTPAPSNPFAGANNPAPAQPTQAPQQPPQVATPQNVAPRQPLGYAPQQYQRPMGYAPMQMPQQMQPQQSMTQQVGGRGNAQNIQNYMTALRQTGAGAGNAYMNAPGQMGVQSNVGFRGFGQNGIQTQLGGQFVGPQQQFTPIQYQNNMANASPNYYAGNQAYAPGLNYAVAPRLANTGGVSTVNGPGLAMGAQYGAPQYNIPGPWLNPQNTPQNSDQWEGYFFQDPSDENYYNPNVNPNNPKQSGAFYTNDFEQTSDANAKTNIESGKGQLEDFMKQLGANYSEQQVEEFMKPLGIHAYDYKDKKHGEGRYVSPMAQEFSQSEIGKSAIVRDPESGYMKVDYGRLMGVTTAAVALLNHKYNNLEKQFKKSIKANLKKKRGK